LLYRALPCIKYFAPFGADPLWSGKKKLRNHHPGASSEHNFYFSVFDTKAQVLS
jgi:hypothetical protein